MNQDIIFGKDKRTNIVSCEINENHIELFCETEGKVTSEFLPNQYWILSSEPYGPQWARLSGNLHYKYLRLFEDHQEFTQAKRQLYKKDCYIAWDNKEAAMLLNGFTYFKGLKPKEVSVLSFDIETTGLELNSQSKVLLISNTYRNVNETETKLFSYDDYKSEGEMIDAWCEWVKHRNPTILLGHNIYSFDLPYLNFCARRANTTLNLGRDNSDIRFLHKESKFRIDGAKDYTYFKCFIYGREIIDTLFLSYRYDIVVKKYESYNLKNITKQEGLEAKDRQFYDASQIRVKYKDPEEFKKIKEYCKFDSQDALKLFDLMIPAYFYLTRSIPKSFQGMLTSASGSQLNSLLVRAYLQDNHSIPKASEGVKFEGAISLGNPGIYRQVEKLDVASLYPSIMLEFKVQDKFKDPKQYFLQMVETFTKERLNNKKLGKETGEQYYKDLDASGKIVINSAYGLLGTPGLNFNSPANASMVTRKGREILTKAIDWANENGFTLVNADTDSISITYKGEYLSLEERQNILDCLNSISPDKIHWEDDGYFESVLVVKIKNYVLNDGKKLKIKGSSLKASMKEPGFKQFIDEIINVLLEGKKEEVINIYNKYIKKLYTITDITPWCSKKNVTEAVLNPERTNEQKVFDAIEGTEYGQGDKLYVYFDKEGKVKLKEQWKQDHDVINLSSKLFKTLKIFETVIDIKLYPNYALKKHENEARAMVGLPSIIKPKKVKNVKKNHTLYNNSSSSKSLST